MFETKLDASKATLKASHSVSIARPSGSTYFTGLLPRSCRWRARRSGTNCYLLEQTTKFSYFYQEMMLKNQKNRFHKPAALGIYLQKLSFPCNVSPFYPKICSLTSKIRVKWGSLWPYSYILVISILFFSMLSNNFALSLFDYQKSFFQNLKKDYFQVLI